MNVTALRAIVGFAIGACLVAGPSVAQQSYPSRPIEIVVPFAAGGSVDITMRLIGTDCCAAR